MLFWRCSASYINNLLFLEECSTWKIADEDIPDADNETIMWKEIKYYKSKYLDTFFSQDCFHNNAIFKFSDLMSLRA